MVGRRLGRFHILSPLGQGGMATVWKATDELLGRRVAVKVMAEALGRSPDAQKRFRHEGEIAALLDHPAIVPVYEAGEHDGLAYLVMALVDGETLSERLTRRLLPIPEALRIVRTVAEVLGYAHGRGVLHRDVTARNVMIARDDRVFVMDFGLARAYGRSRVTTSTGVLGTVAYMAPEVLSGQEADPRSDLYGLGVVLYEALTGVLPYAGARDEVVAYASLHLAMEPPSALRPEIGPALDRLALRALARDPAMRYQSAEELIEDLHSVETTVSGATVNGAPGGGREANAGLGPTETEAITEPIPVPSTLPASGLPARLATGTAPIYLAILPIELPEPPDDAGGEHARLARDLTETLGSALAQLHRLHIVAMSEDVKSPAGGALRDLGRRTGASLVLRASLRFDGTIARVTYALLEPERAIWIAGGAVDGSTLEPFDLEDRFVAGVSRALGFAADEAPSEWRARPRDPAARERFAQALSYMHRFDHEASLEGAIGLLEGLLKSEGNSAAVHAALARAFLRKYQLMTQRVWEAKAAQSCARARELDPHAPEVILAIGELHVAAGRHAEALAELDRALALRPGLSEAHFTRAMALDGLGRVAEAEEACQRGITQRPSDWHGYYTLGLIFFARGRYAQAVGPWRRVTELVPDNAGAHRNLGSAFFRLDRLDEAISAFQRSNEIRPNAMAFYNLGTALFMLERYEECIEAFEKAVALNPADPVTWGNLGNACRYIPGRESRMREALDRAIGLMRERLEREPGDAEAWARLAGWWTNLGRREEARSAISRALGMTPNVHVIVMVARELLELGHRPEALRWLRRAVEDGYGVEVLRRSHSLRVLKGDPEFERILEEGSRPRGADERAGTRGGGLR